MQEDCCLVCAEALTFTGFGPCGHKEVCSKCVARLRFVLKDKRCVLCTQDCPQVFFTRYAGDYTARLDPEQFADLKARADRREIHYLPDIDGFFDDNKHYQQLRSLCGYTHPILETSTEPGKHPPRFTSLNALKKHIEGTHKESFCDICLASRKVFISEQVLYTKDSLRRHNECGDESGPLAESGFKGHPACKFCRTRFYDSADLFKHMESGHEHCFLCRKADPGKYVYYRHYKELEEHFGKAHHVCPHPICLEKRFVVFNTDYELKAHFANEHGDDVKMSAAQRRAALTIPIQLQYRTQDEVAAEAASAVQWRDERPATVIGGGQNYPTSTRGGRRGQQSGSNNSSSNMHHSRSQPQLSRPDYAAEVPSEPEVSSVQFTAEDFPAASGSSMQPHGAMGLWAAFAGAGAGSSRSLMDAQFPALPALSRAQKKRVQEASKSLASRLSAAAQPPRVLNRAVAGAGPPGYTTAAAAAAVPPQVPQGSVPGASFQDVFPALSSVGGAGGMSGPCQWLGSGGAFGSNANTGGSGSASGSGAAQPHRNFVDPGPSVLAASLLGFTTAGGSSSSASGAGPGQAAGAGSGSIASPSGPSRTQAALVAPLGGGRPPALGVQDFPSLAGTGGPSSGSGMTRPAPASAAMNGRTGSSSSLSALFSAGTSSSSINANSSSSSSAQRPASALGMGSGRAAVAASQMYQAAPKLETDDFPSLPVAPKGGKGKAKGKATAVAASPAAAPASSSSGSAAARVLGGPGPSEALKAANRALVEKIKGQLSSDAFSTFKDVSGHFHRGAVGAEEFHGYMVSLGLLGLTTEVAALCPNGPRRSALLSSHRTFLSSPAAHDPALVGPNWVPPEVALQRAAAAEQAASWECMRCTLVNAPGEDLCEACGLHRLQAERQRQAQEAALLSTSIRAAMSAATPSYGGGLGGGGSSSSGSGMTGSSQRAANLEDAFPALPSPPPSSASMSGLVSRTASLGLGGSSSSSAHAVSADAASPSNGKKGKAGKQTIRIGLPAQGSGPAPSTAKPPPASAWGGSQQPLKKDAVAGFAPAPPPKAANQWKGAGAGKVAKSQSAINDAWGK